MMAERTGRKITPLVKAMRGEPERELEFSINAIKLSAEDLFNDILYLTRTPIKPSSIKLAIIALGSIMYFDGVANDVSGRMKEIARASVSPSTRAMHNELFAAFASAVNSVAIKVTDDPEPVLRKLVSLSIEKPDPEVLRVAEAVAVDPRLNDFLAKLRSEVAKAQREMANGGRRYTDSDITAFKDIIDNVANNVIDTAAHVRLRNIGPLVESLQESYGLLVWRSIAFALDRTEKASQGLSNLSHTGSGHLVSSAVGLLKYRSSKKHESGPKTVEQLGVFSQHYKNTRNLSAYIGVIREDAEAHTQLLKVFNKLNDSVVLGRLLEFFITAEATARESAANAIRDAGKKLSDIKMVVSGILNGEELSSQEGQSER
jgi:hypothetical protein